MDVNSDQKNGLNHTFRQSVMNMFMKKLMEWRKNPTDPNLQRRLKELTLTFEAATYKKATSKDDYLAMIKNKLNDIVSSTLSRDAAAPATENQPMSRQVVHFNQSTQQNLIAGSSVQENQTSFPSTPHSIHAPRMPMPTATWSTMQQRNATIQPAAFNQIQKNRVFECQNVLLQSDGLQHPSVQHTRPMKEPFQTTNSMMNIRSYHQQSSQLRSPVVKLEQGIRLQDTREQKSHMPSTPLYPQPSAVPQSQVACTKALTGSSFLDAETVNAADRKLFMAQYHRARTMYLPDLIRVHKKAEEECAKALGVFECEKAEHCRSICQIYEQSIKFLQIPENDLNRVSKENLRRLLDRVTKVFNSINKMIARGNQAPQVSNGQVSVNHLQNTPSVLHSTIVTNPGISSSTMEKVFTHHSQSNAPVSPLYCSPGATKWRDVQTVSNKGPQGTAEQNAHLNLKRNSEAMQPPNTDQPLKKQQLKKPRKLPKEKDFMDSMFISSTKFTSTNAQSRPSRGLPTSTKQPPLQKRNTLCISDPRAMSQLKPSAVAVGLASTPETPSSVPKEIRKPAEFVPPKELGAETEVQDNPVELGTSGTSTSSLPSDSCGAESSQLPRSAMPPIQRLLQAVQSGSKKGTLKSAMNDIASAINDMDKLPEYARNDESNLWYDDEHMPRRRLKCNIDVISRDPSTTVV